MIINIKYDVNDCDLRYVKSQFNEEDLPILRKVGKVLEKFRAYKTVNDWGSESYCTHNFPWGNMTLYGLDVMCRKDMGQKSAYELYVKKKKISEYEYEIFTKYLKNRCFHTIHQIKIDNEIIYKRSFENNYFNIRKLKNF